MMAAGVVVAPSCLFWPSRRLALFLSLVWAEVAASQRPSLTITDLDVVMTANTVQYRNFFSRSREFD